MSTKKTFIFYSDWIDYTQGMTNEEKGILFQTILDYQNGKGITNDNIVIRMLFPRIKKQLDEDNKKREEEREKRSKAGIEGMKSRRGKIVTNDNIVITKNNNVIESITKITDNVNDNDNDNDNNNIIKQNVINDIEPNGSTKNIPIIPEIGKEEIKLKLQNLKVKLSTITAEEEKESSAKEKESYGNEEINKILEIVKKYNNGIVDGTIKEQRQYGKHLLESLKKIDSVKRGSYTFDSILEIIIKTISQDQYHSHKITSPKKIYYELAGLMQICRQKIQKEDESKIPFIPGV